MKTAPKQYSSGRSAAPYFGALDGFRGLLAVFVAIYHTYWFTHINNTDFFNHGPVIIDLFFVFSGFLLFTLYGSRIRTPKEGVHFIKKRFARLYPLHLFVLCIFIMFASFRVVMHALGYADMQPGEIMPFQPGARESIVTVFSNLTLTQAMGVHDFNTFNVPAWTISVEFFAYFTFAALLIWAPPRKDWHFALIAIGVAALYMILAALKPDMNITYDYAFLRCLGGFYTGVVVARIYAGIKNSARIKSMSLGLASILEGLTVLGSTLFVIYCPGKLQFLVAPVMLVFVLVFAFDKGLVSRFMMIRPFRYLARISYSVYMTHMIISVVFYAFANIVLARFFGPEWYAQGINGDLYLLPYLACVFVFSHITQRFVEVPANKFLMSRKFGFGRRHLSKS